MIVESKIFKRKFKIQFIKESIRLKNGRTVVHTHCKVSFLGGNCWYKISGFWTSRQNPKDKYDHVTGKAIAFGRALKGLADHMGWKPGYINRESLNKVRKSRVNEFWPAFEREFGPLNPNTRKLMAAQPIET